MFDTLVAQFWNILDTQPYLLLLSAVLSGFVTYVFVRAIIFPIFFPKPAKQNQHTNGLNRENRKMRRAMRNKKGRAAFNGAIQKEIDTAKRLQDK